MSKLKAALCAAIVVLGLHTAGLAEGDVTVGVGADFFSSTSARPESRRRLGVPAQRQRRLQGLTGSIWAISI